MVVKDLHLGAQVAKWSDLGKINTSYLGPTRVLINFASFLPEGNQVFVHTYSLHRDPRYFSIPNTFWPDRWISAEDRKPPANGEVVHPDQFVHDTGAFLPFSIGPANCAGKNLALLELRALVCHLLQKFDFHIPESEAQRMEFEKWEEGVRDHVVLSRPSLPVVVKVRV